MIEYLKQTYNIDRFCFWGRSMGAVTAVLYCEKNLYVRQCHVSCLVLDSPFSKVSTMVSDVAKNQIGLPAFVTTMGMHIIKKTIKEKINFDVTLLEPIVSSRHLTIPAAFIYAKEDKLVYPIRTKEYYDGYKCKNKILIPSEFEHNSDREEHCLSQAYGFMLNVLNHETLNDLTDVENSPQNASVIFDNNGGRTMTPIQDEYARSFSRDVKAGKIKLDRQNKESLVKLFSALQESNDRPLRDYNKNASIFEDEHEHSISPVQKPTTYAHRYAESGGIPERHDKNNFPLSGIIQGAESPTSPSQTITIRRHNTLQPDNVNMSTDMGKAITIHSNRGNTNVRTADVVSDQVNNLRIIPLKGEAGSTNIPSNRSKSEMPHLRPASIIAQEPMGSPPKVTIYSRKPEEQTQSQIRYSIPSEMSPHSRVNTILSRNPTASHPQQQAQRPEQQRKSPVPVQVPQPQPISTYNPLRESFAERNYPGQDRIRLSNKTNEFTNTLSMRNTQPSVTTTTTIIPSSNTAGASRSILQRQDSDARPSFIIPASVNDPLRGYQNESRLHFNSQLADYKQEQANPRTTIEMEDDMQKVASSLIH